MSKRPTADDDGKLADAVRMIDRLKESKPLLTYVSGRGWVLVISSRRGQPIAEFVSHRATLEEGLPLLIEEAIKYWEGL